MRFLCIKQLISLPFFSASVLFRKLEIFDFTQDVQRRIMEAPEYLDLDEIDFSDDISVSITTYKECSQEILPSPTWAAFSISLNILNSFNLI